MITGTFSLLFVHYWALMVKRLIYIKRDKKGFLAEIFLPCCIIVAGMGIQLVTFIYEPTSLLMNASVLYPEAVPLKTLYAYGPNVSINNFQGYFNASTYMLNFTTDNTLQSWESTALSLTSRTRKGQFFVS